MDHATLDALEVLGNRNRIHIIVTLYSGDLSAVDFAMMLDMSITGVMKHLRLLEQAGLITRKKVGRRNMCSLSKDMLHAIRDWPEILEVNWLDMVVLDSK